MHKNNFSFEKIETVLYEESFCLIPPAKKQYLPEDSRQSAKTKNLLPRRRFINRFLTHGQSLA